MLSVQTEKSLRVIATGRQKGRKQENMKKKEKHLMATKHTKNKLSSRLPRYALVDVVVPFLLYDELFGQWSLLGRALEWMQPIYANDSS